MLYLYRPRQTWMPYAMPRNMYRQTEYNREMQARFAATRRVAAAPVEPDPIARLKDLAQLHADGALSDEEFATAKAKILGLEEPSS